MNKCIYPVLVALVLVLGCLSACGVAAQPADVNPGDVAAGPILSCVTDAGITELVACFADGHVPEEVNILYDQMGSNPDITITDAETISEIYRLLSGVEVVGQAHMSVTDCYHHIQFKLGEAKYVYFAFEGEEIWCYGQSSYELKNSKQLFRYMWELTKEYCKQMDDQ